MLDTEVNYAKDRLGVIVGQANETQELVSATHNDSLTIYRDIYAINLPDIDAGVLKRNISNLNAQVRYTTSCYYCGYNGTRTPPGRGIYQTKFNASFENRIARSILLRFRLKEKTLLIFVFAAFFDFRFARFPGPM